MTSPDAAALTPDFTIRREPHTFTIDDDTFSAPAILSPITLRKLAAESATIGDLDRLSDLDSVLKAIEAVSTIMTALMPGSSGKRFKARLESEGRDADPDDGRPQADPKPIDLMQQAIPAFYYLLECYGMRPTVPSSPLLTGLTDGAMDTLSDGTSSMAGPSPAESISAP